MTTGLPRWRSVCAVVAHPDDESFGLGAVIAAFADAGCRVTVVCLTHGEASTLHGVGGDLRVVRQQELRAAGEILGVAEVVLLDHPDGGLAGLPSASLDDDLDAATAGRFIDGLLVFDTTGITGHPDHIAATEAAMRLGRRLDVPVLAWTIPLEVATRCAAELEAGYVGQPPDAVDLVLAVDRAVQLEAIRAHASQATPGSALWRRLELTGGQEHLRWLVRPSA